jgi:hypothetical protein
LAAIVARILAFCSSVHARFFFFAATSVTSVGSGVSRALGGGSVGSGVARICLTRLSPDSGSVVRRRITVTSGCGGSSRANGRCVSVSAMDHRVPFPGATCIRAPWSRLITRPSCHATFPIPKVNDPWQLRLHGAASR